MRELFNRYSNPLPFHAVCSAYSRGVLNDDDIADASDNVLKQITQLEELSS